MYRITEEIAKYISSHAKSPDIPGLQKDNLNPFTPRNKYSIGLIDNTIAYNTDALYLIEIDLEMLGFFLYRNGELKQPNDTMEMPKAHVDPHTIDMDTKLDIADCSVEMPDQIRKLTEAVRVKKLKDLLEKEPELAMCLNLAKEKKNGKGFLRRLLEISTFGIFNESS